MPEFNKVQNMLLGVMIGDAFGSAYEFTEKEWLNLKVDMTCYNANPRENYNKTPGMYTDDTQMSLAVAELLLSFRPFHTLNLAGNFIIAFDRDPFNGYSRKFQSFIENVGTAEEFLLNFNNNSERNGAAMRSVPLGVLKEKEKAVEYATINAKLTHDTPKGIASSVAVALMSHYYMHDIQGGLLDYMLPAVRQIDNESAVHYEKAYNLPDFDTRLLFGEKHENMGIPCDGMRTVGGVLYVLKNHDSPVDVLKRAVMLGGDTDSTASIALGLKMIKHDVSELPSFLFNDLTNHAYGRDYAIRIGERLHQKYF